MTLEHRKRAADDRSMVFETVRVRREGGVLLAEIAAPPMNLMGPDLVRDLVSLTQRGEADNTIQVVAQREPARAFQIAHGSDCTPLRFRNGQSLHHHVPSLDGP